MEEERLKATEEFANPTWRGKRGEVAIKDMDTNHLQIAKLHAQKRELFFYHNAFIFTKKIEELEAEAAKRGIILRDIDTGKEPNPFLNNNRKLKAVKS